MVKRLIEALQAAGLDLTPREVAEALWLAGELDAPAGVAYRPSAEPPAAASHTPVQAGGTPPPPEDARALAQGHAAAVDGHDRVGQRPSTPVHVHQGQERGFAGGGKGAMEFRSPAVAALPGTLALARALRPLTRRIDSRVEVVLDESATAEHIAEGLLRGCATARGPTDPIGSPDLQPAVRRLLLPVLRPAPSRWLDMAVVVDDSASMVIWRRTILEFVALLEGLGAFRVVSTWRLSTDADPVNLHHGFPARRREEDIGRDPRELVDPLGRRIVLVVSDCIAWGWYDGRVAKALSLYAEKGQVAIVQMLPSRLWTRTGLRWALPVHIQASVFGVACKPLPAAVAPDRLGDVPAEGAPAVPIIVLEPESIGEWAQMVAGVGGACPPALVLSRSHEPESTDSAGQAPTPQQGIDTFRSWASPTAQKLAAYLATVPLTLPVMRLVQQVMLPASSQTHLAEVFLSGLLRRVLPAEESDETVYDFVEGVRQVLVSSLRVSEVAEVMCRTSALVDDKTGGPVDFRALIADPTRRGRWRVGERSLPFARVSASVLRWLGEPYAGLAERLVGDGPIEDGNDHGLGVDATTVTGPCETMAMPAALVITSLPVRQLLAEMDLAADMEQVIGGVRVDALVGLVGRKERPPVALEQYDASRGDDGSHIARLIQTLQPRVVVFLGTAAGVGGREWGEVVIAESVMDAGPPMRRQGEGDGRVCVPRLSTALATAARQAAQRSGIVATVVPVLVMAHPAAADGPLPEPHHGAVMNAPLVPALTALDATAPDCAVILAITDAAADREIPVGMRETSVRHAIELTFQLLKEWPTQGKWGEAPPEVSEGDVVELVVSLGETGNWVTPEEIAHLVMGAPDWFVESLSRRDKERVAQGVASLLARIGEVSHGEEHALTVWVRLLTGLGRVCHHLGRLADAGSALELALPFVRRAGPALAGEDARILNFRGWLALERRDLTRAERDCLESRRISRGIDDVGEEARACHNLGVIYQRAEEFGRARDELRKALELAKTAGLTGVQVRVSNSIGDLLKQEGDWRAAEDALRQAITLAETSGNRHEASRAYNSLGLLFQDQAHWVEAEGAFEKALALARDEGNRDMTMRILNSLGHAEAQMGRWQGAEVRRRDALALAIDLGDEREAAETRARLTELDQRRRAVSSVEIEPEAFELLVQGVPTGRWRVLREGRTTGQVRSAVFEGDTASLWFRLDFTDSGVAHQLTGKFSEQNGWDHITLDGADLDGASFAVSLARLGGNAAVAAVDVRSGSKGTWEVRFQAAVTTGVQPPATQSRGPRRPGERSGKAAE